jgi:hypothetical protein
MTNKYGIIVRNWPLKDFKCPGKINSLPALLVLYNAFKNDVATFYKMSPAELEDWRDQRFCAVPVPSSTPLSLPPSNIETPVPTSVPLPTPAISPAPDAPAPTPEAIDPTVVIAVASNSILDPTPSNAIVPIIGDKRTYSAVFTVDGQQLVTKKPRKQRSDKGKKRGANARARGIAE